MQANRNMSSAEKFGAVRTLEDAIDTLEKLQAGEDTAYRGSRRVCRSSGSNGGSLSPVVGPATGGFREGVP